MIENFQINDWYFSKFDNVLNMDYIDLIDNSFLVRQIIEDKTKIKLCYKSKKLDGNGNVIEEQKTNANVDDLQNTLKIFALAKLNNYCTVKNNSYVYQKDDICFAVQIVENLGIFIEYEQSPAMQNFSPSEKFDAMVKIVNNLGLKLGNDYSCKKVFMLLQKAKAN